MAKKFRISFSVSVILYADSEDSAMEKIENMIGNDASVIEHDITAIRVKEDE